PVRSRAERPLADEQSHLGDAVEEVGMAERIRPVEPAGEYRGGEATRGERGPVRRCVDAVRAPGDHRPSPLSQRVRHVGRDVCAVVAGGARPDDGHRPVERLVEGDVAAYPETMWRISIPFARCPAVRPADVDEVVELAWPLLVLGRHRPGAEPAGGGEQRLGESPGVSADSATGAVAVAGSTGQP